MVIELDSFILQMKGFSKDQDIFSCFCILIFVFFKKNIFIWENWEKGVGVEFVFFYKIF